MKNAMKSLIIDFVFLAIVYFGVIGDIEGCKNLLYFSTLFITFMNIICYFSNECIEKLVSMGFPTLPMWFDNLYNLVIMAILVWNSYWFMAFLYFVSALFSYAIVNKVKIFKNRVK
jgi:hypothetical protein